jgi:pimeloyl-ACP methyl ester carboxylesterase
MMSTPRVDDKSAAAAAEALYEALRGDPRPMLILWAESDIFLTLTSGERLATRIGRQIDHLIPQAGHALLEDQGQMISELIVDWLQGGD